MKYLFYSEEPEEGGTVFVTGAHGNGQYEDGAEITLFARPAAGWAFSHWAERDWAERDWAERDWVYPEPEITVCMTEDRAIAAHFYKKRVA